MSTFDGGSPSPAIARAGGPRPVGSAAMQLEEMQAVVIEAIEPFLGEAVAFDAETSLLEAGHIDSTTMILIILDLERRLGCTIGVTAIGFDDFASVRTLAQQLCRIKAAS